MQPLVRAGSPRGSRWEEAEIGGEPRSWAQPLAKAEINQEATPGSVNLENKGVGDARHRDTRACPGVRKSRKMAGTD